jgi:hypothetical protein
VLGPVIIVLAAIGAFALFAGGGDDDDDGVAGADATETAEATLTEGAATDDETPTPTRTPTPTTIPTATPTRPPQDSQINNITLSGGRYIVDFSTFGFVADIADGDFHVHFFFDTVPPIEAGMPFDGPWFVYDVPNPFTGYGTVDRPAGAEQMCILVARADHSVIQDTGNCFDLP